MQKEMAEIRQYVYLRISEMPMVKGVEVEDGPEVFIDVSKVNEKHYNGVLIRSAEKVAQILNEEYGAKVAACEDEKRGTCISISLENSAEVLKKTLNRVEAFVSSI